MKRIFLNAEEVETLLDMVEAEVPWSVLAEDEGVEEDVLRRAVQEWAGVGGISVPAKVQELTAAPPLREEGRIVTDAFILQVAALRKEGHTNAEIARAVGCSIPTVRRAAGAWAERHGEDLPSRRAVLGERRNIQGRIIHLRREGHSYTDISELVGVCVSTVKARVLRHLDTTGEDLRGRRQVSRAELRRQLREARSA